MSALAVLIVYLGAHRTCRQCAAWSARATVSAAAHGSPLPAVQYIVVLGSGYEPRDGIPVTAALDEAGLVRIVEGIRLMRRLGATRLVVSGGAPPGQGRSAIGYAQLARELGVSDSSLVILDTPRDTAAEARVVVELLGQSPFVLVTSAFHMPRAMRLMQRVGAHPIPAPTGQLADNAAIRWGDLLPNSRRAATD